MRPPNLFGCKRMHDALILVSTAQEFNAWALLTLAAAKQTLGDLAILKNPTQCCGKSCFVQKGWRGSVPSLSFGPTAAAPAENVVEGDGTSAKEDQGERQCCSGEWELVSGPIGDPISPLCKCTFQRATARSTQTANAATRVKNPARSKRPPRNSVKTRRNPASAARRGWQSTVRGGASLQRRCDSRVQP